MTKRSKTIFWDGFSLVDKKDSLHKKTKLDSLKIQCITAFVKDY